MLGFIVSQLRFRRGRVAALGLGILVTAVSFTLLLSAAETSELRVRRVVAENFRPAYDILVRPEDSFTSLEKERGLVQQNYLSGIFGGISFKQYRAIENIAGVQLAAPIANIGYIPPFEGIRVIINRFVNDDPEQMYRLRQIWKANGGLSRYRDTDHYVYLTQRDPFVNVGNGLYGQQVPGRAKPYPICNEFYRDIPIGGVNPFGRRPNTGLDCFSDLTPDIGGAEVDFGAVRGGSIGIVTSGYFPLLVAAVDPKKETQLLDLDQAIVSGRMLRDDDGAKVADQLPKGRRSGPGFAEEFVPLIASTRNFIDEQLEIRIERLRTPVGRELTRRLSTGNAFRFATELEGDVVGTLTYSLKPVYERLIDEMSLPAWRSDIGYPGYWKGAQVAYHSSSSKRVTPLTVRNPREVFNNGYYGCCWAPQENRDVQFRNLEGFEANSTMNLAPNLVVVGRFDPELLPGFSPLSEVPLETYYPPQVEAADAQSEKALDGRPLLPTQNLGDYVSQPPLLLTTLDGLKAFIDPNKFLGASPKKPISVIRVRVAGVKGPDPLSRERIRRVAQDIHHHTGLAVDITAGSSPRDVVVELPAGKFGRPALTLKEGWVEKGVAIKFLKAVDEKSLTLFVLILVTCGFFLANGAFAAARSRRREIGTLSCLGWTKAKIFTAVLGELAVTGIVAGLLGALVAVITVQALSLTMSLARTLLVVPVALLLAVTAGVIPAYRAARTRPIEVVAHSTTEARRGRSARHIYTMALAGLRRRPSRTLLGVLGLAIGVASLALLLAVNDAFQGVLVGNLMGEFISIEIKGADYLSVGLVIFLGGVSIADVLYLNLKERAPELVTLKTVGWRGSHLVRLIAAEGLSMGALGSLLGAGLAVGLSNLIPQLPTASIVLAVALAGAAGITVAALAALFPVTKISGLTPPTVLAEE